VPSILMVVSSHDRLGHSGRATGAWLEELAASYYAFIDAGCEVAIASPLGGPAPLDPLSLEPPWLTGHGRRFEADRAAMTKLRESLSLDVASAGQFDALYLVGGAATAWDFPGNAVLAAIVEELFHRGRPVAGVCHGVLGLTHALDARGRPIVRDRAVTGVSNAEEVMTGFDALVPVLPENRLRELGARYSCAAPLASHVQIDANVLTGQNPASAGPLAHAVLRYLADVSPVSHSSTA
jgi:putative intracellular protease/amidase